MHGWVANNIRWRAIKAPVQREFEGGASVNCVEVGAACTTPFIEEVEASWNGVPDFLDDHAICMAPTKAPGVCSLSGLPLLNV